MLKLQNLISPFIKKIFAIVALIFFLYFFINNRTEIYEVIKNSNPIYIFSAVTLWATLNFVSPYFTRYCLLTLKINIEYSLLRSIFFRNLPAKYLPGGVWHTVSRYAIYNEKGVTKSQLSYLFALETLIPVLIAAMLGFSAYFYSDSFGTILISISVLLLFSCTILAIRGTSNYISYIATTLIITMIFWSIASSSFLLYVYAFSDSGQTIAQDSLTIIGAYLIGWSSGNLAIFSPQGIGVSEAVSSSLLNGTKNFGTTVSILFGFRIVIAFTDILSWLLFTYFDKKNPYETLFK